MPHVAVQDLTVRAALDGDREHVHHAAILDRHTSSVLSLEDTRAMVSDLLEAHAATLPEALRGAGAASV